MVICKNLKMIFKSAIMEASNAFTNIAMVLDSLQEKFILVKGWRMEVARAWTV